MGTQFWWFYDAMAAAIVLICIFFSGKKGVMKGTFAMTGCLIATLAAYGISGALTGSIFESYVKTTSIRKISNHVEQETFVRGYVSYLGNMGYILNVNYDKVEGILLSKDVDYTEKLMNYVNNVNSYAVEKNEDVLRQKINEGYAVVIKDIVSKSIGNKYVAESAYKEVMDNPESIYELLPLITAKEIQHDGVVYIVDNYVSVAYQTFFRLIAFVVLFILLWIIIAICINSFMGSRHDNFVTTSGHIGGGFIGIITSVFVVFAAATIVRLFAILGSNEMLFFNNDAVDMTYVFKYFYKFAMML